MNSKDRNRITDVSSAVLHNAWRRSEQFGVDQVADPNRFTLRPVNTETRFYRAVTRVLEVVEDDFNGEPFGLIFTDRDGTIVKVVAGDRAFKGALQVARAEPGVSYSEETLGANAVGTVLEAGMGVHFRGEEHYNWNMHDFSCLATPIREPKTQRTIGVINMCSHVTRDQTLSAPYVRAVARQLVQCYSDSAQETRTRLHERYLTACAKYGAVAAVSDESLLVSSEAMALLGRDDIRRLQEIVDSGELTAEDATALPQGIEMLDPPLASARSGVVFAISRRSPPRSPTTDGEYEAALSDARKWPRIDALERDAVLQALRINGGNKAAAADWLGISRRTIYNKISRFRITTSEIKIDNPVATP